MIILEVPATGVDDGYQDPETLVIHYDPVKTPWGPLENLKVRDGRIVEAGEIVLIKRGHPEIVDGTLRVVASNGTVTYRVLPDEVEWSDRRGEPIGMQLGLLVSSDWSE